MTKGEVHSGFGAWLDNFENVVDFAPGKRRKLAVLLRKRDGNIYAITNPRDEPLPTRTARAFVKALARAAPIEYRILPARDMTVCVTLLDSRGAKLREKQFNCKMTEGGDFQLTVND